MSLDPASDVLTAVVITFPAVHSLVDPWRLEADPSAAWGVPAHVTVMYPFVPAGLVTGDVVDRLSRVLGAYEPFTCTFSSCAWFGDDVLYLAPDAADEFLRMSADIEAEFPGVRLYEGVHDTVVPHVTLGVRGAASAEVLAAAEAAVASGLPVVERVDRALLMAGNDAPGSWHVVATLPFHGPRP